MALSSVHRDGTAFWRCHGDYYQIQSLVQRNVLMVLSLLLLLLSLLSLQVLMLLLLLLLLLLMVLLL
jgi:hypothetical protein